MCLKVFMPEGNASNGNCTYNDTPKIADCPGNGSRPYVSSVSQPWAWGAQVYPAEGPGKLSYFIGVVIEWFDR